MHGRSIPALAAEKLERHSDAEEVEHCYRELPSEERPISERHHPSTVKREPRVQHFLRWARDDRFPALDPPFSPSEPEVCRPAHQTSPCRAPGCASFFASSDSIWVSSSSKYLRASSQAIRV